MKQAIRDLIIGGLAMPPVPSIVQSLKGRRNTIGIFTYHAVIEEPLPFFDWCFLDAELFRKQVAYLSKHFDIISLSDAADMVQAGEIDGPKAVITFDDGYKNNHDVALPILKEYSAPASIYLVSDLLGSDRSVWFTRLIMALDGTPLKQVSFQDRSWTITTADEKANCCADMQQMLKHLSHAELLEKVGEIEDLLQMPRDPVLSEDSPFRMLDQQTFDNMLSSGLIEFGAHTRNHMILSRLSSEVKQEQIASSIAGVEQLTGKRCEHFAYPNGSLDDYDNESIDMLAANNIRSAVTMNPGPVAASDNMLQLNRYPVGADTTYSRFKLMAHHVA